MKKFNHKITQPHKMAKAPMKRLGLFCMPLAFVACTTATGGGNLEAVVTQHSEAIQQLQAQVSGVQPAQADNWSQVQSLRQEIASLRGDLDNLNNSTAHLGGVSQLGAIIARHDRALRLIESQMALDLQLSNNDMSMYSSNPNLPQANKNSAQTPPATTIAPVITTPPPSQNQSTAPAKPQDADVAKALYDSGINNFNNRNYTNALNAFIDFPQQFPNHQLVSNAWFWQGESYYQLKNYAQAALAYEKVISGFPNSIKAPAAYLKQGMAFIALDKKAAGKERLTHLVNTYPKAPEARRAEQVLKTL